MQESIADFVKWVEDFTVEADFSEVESLEPPELSIEYAVKEFSDWLESKQKKISLKVMLKFSELAKTTPKFDRLCTIMDK